MKLWVKMTLNLQIPFSLFRKCVCSNDEEKIVTNFGCINGGVPRCRVDGKVSNSGPFGNYFANV